jgi:hypothetical protein
VGSSDNLAALRVRLTTLLEQLKMEASRVSHDHAYAIRRFHRCSGVTIEADGSGDEPWTVTITRRGAGSTQMTVPSYVARLFAWVANTSGVFGSTEPLPLFPPGCGEWIESELKMMEQMKVIESVNM